MQNPASQPLLGVGLMVLAVILFTVLDSLAKIATRELPVPQVVWGRYAFNLALMTLFLPRMGWRRVTRTQRPMFQTIRALMLVLATGSMFMAVKRLPLADVYAISFISPLLVAALAALLLRERGGWQRWALIVVGFAGVLIVIRPGAGPIGLSAVFPLLMAGFYAVYQVMTRMLGGTEGAVSTLFYTVLVGTAAATAIVPFFWLAPTPGLWALLVVMGAVGLVGQFLLIRALSLAAASLMSPFAYTQIVWATIIGYVVFGDMPDAATLLGAAVVVASGLGLVWRDVGWK